jgi:uncharacterized FAD-dependent dehydrogenase
VIKISGLRFAADYDNEALAAAAAAKLGMTRDKIIRAYPARRELVTEKDEKGVVSDVYFKMDIIAEVGDEEEALRRCHDPQVSRELKMVYLIPRRVKLARRPVIVGGGPAGMFAALVLSLAGARPILLERGPDIDERRRRVGELMRTGTLDENANFQFGEGGAGAFSDGKLKLGRMDYRRFFVLGQFVEAGAPKEIMYDSRRHIGTDRLPEAVRGIRKKIVSLGGEMLFGAKVTDIIIKDGSVRTVRYETSGGAAELEADSVILAVGHSARDTFDMLLARGAKLVSRPIAVGVRIEHPQKLIDTLKYGRFAGTPALGAADYRMVVHLEERGVYTFCMCPGGFVVPAASENGCLVTNGMSRYDRGGENANTALLVTVGAQELGGTGPLAAVEYQRRVEQAAFAAGGGNFKAPVQRLCDFMQRRETTSFGDVLPTYRPGVNFAPVDSYLPAPLAQALRRGVAEMDAWMPGFAYPDALLTGAETRSSSPVRMLRGDTLEAEGICGLYPCGEGAGYAGGIVSSAVDGMLCAERILDKAHR